MSVDLVFKKPPLTQPATLLFNEQDAAPIAKDATVSAEISLPLFAITASVGMGVAVEAEIGLPTFELEAEVTYFTDTSRPLVAQVDARWQDALTHKAYVEMGWQDGVRAPNYFDSRYQDGIALHDSLDIEWNDADRGARVVADSRFQDALPLHESKTMRFEDALRTMRPAVDSRFQDGVGLDRSVEVRFQDAIRGIAGERLSRYQDALPLGFVIEQQINRGIAMHRGWTSRYQDAMSPPAGRHSYEPEPPELPEPCYTPSGDLVFSVPWSSDTNLVFVCEAHGPGPEPDPDTIVVPIKKVYVVFNTATLHRVDGNVLLPTFSMSLSLDVDSWTWSFSASLPGRALPDVEPESDGHPVLVEAVINAVPYRFLIEKIGRERSFAQDGLRVSGRGLAAELDAPIAPIKSFGNTFDRNAQQLMGDVLSINGAPLPDWTVDWQMEDWLVKANAWKKQGSYIDALNAIVAAAGGYLQPTPASKTVRALPRYPALPWAWSDVTPDYELPSAAFTRESIEWTEKARYNRVYVSGQGAGGRLVNVRRAGTAGDVVAPMVTDSLITDSIAGRQRGGAILADTGRIANYSLRSAIGVRDTSNNPVGIIPPGKFVLYTDNGVQKLGITRSVNVEVQMPEIWQTIGVEVHE